MEKQAKKRIFSGIQPSGNLHIGNYLGAISQWVPLQETYDCIYCVVDYHAITVRQDPDRLRRQTIEIAKILMAAGIDPGRSVILKQSLISAHTELAWIMNCVARLGDLNRMTQFKEKAGKVRENTSVGLYDYPALMAADILLYQTDAVPVGEDQTQHVELARTLARRFNHDYGQTFKEPGLIVKKEGARIMGLDDPKKKMSKSAPSEYNYIALLDKPDMAVKKIMKAVTDSGREIIYDPEKKPALANLLNIYSLLSGRKINELEIMYAGKGYGVFKKDLAEAVRHFLLGFQEKYFAISDEAVRDVLSAGAKKASPLAEATMKKAKKRLGIL